MIFGLVWLGVGSFMVPQESRSLYFSVGILTILNIALLGKVVALMLRLRFHERVFIKLASWGALKLLVLGGLIALLWGEREAPLQPKALGLSVLMTLPVVYGLIESQFSRKKIEGEDLRS
jgi:hypothetical protein